MTRLRDLTALAITAFHVHLGLLYLGILPALLV